MGIGRGLRSTIALFGAAALIAATAAEAADSTDARALHALNRLAFGPAPQDLASVRQVGVDAYIEAQLHPEKIAEPPEVASKLAQLRTFRMDPTQLFQTYEPPRPARGQKPDPEVVKAARERSREVALEARQARLIRAV